MFTLNHYAYCGMSVRLAEGDESRVRLVAANYLRRKRNQEYPIHALDKGSRWEICEPDGCMMVPDCCGILRLERVESREDEDDFDDCDFE